jgi:hypothetical protein
MRQKFSAMLKKAEEAEDAAPESSGLWRGCRRG